MREIISANNLKGAVTRASSTWETRFLADDSEVRRLDDAPTAFPFLIFFERGSVPDSDVLPVRTVLLEESVDPATCMEGVQQDRQQEREDRQKDRQCLLRERARGQKREGRQQDRQCRQQRKAFSKEVAIVKGRQLNRKQDRQGRQQDKQRKSREQDRQDRQRDRQDRHQRDERHLSRDQTGADPRVGRAWDTSGGSSNRDGTRKDDHNDRDDPMQRYRENRSLRRRRVNEVSRKWSQNAERILPQPCRLCQLAFPSREKWLDHVKEEHGGLQRYRNALFSLLALKPYVVSGQEWRLIIANFSEFLARSATDWEGFSPEMEEQLEKPEGLHREKRWEPRGRAACVFCARKQWIEDLHKVHLAGPQCFMKNRWAVANLLSVERYANRWPLIPYAELDASAVNLVIDDEGGATKRALLHKRRIETKHLTGTAPSNVCADCFDAFSADNPWLCKYCLANDMWLGRWAPIFRNANVTHQMLMALARIVTTKIVLRPEGRASQAAGAENRWDFLFHQAGMIGSAILFPNADCGDAMRQYPPESMGESFAVSFVATPSMTVEVDDQDPALTTLRGEGLNAPGARAQLYARRTVSKIAKLQLNRREFDDQAALLKETNVVYREADYREDLVAKWVPDKENPAVPNIILDKVVAVPLEGDAGTVISSGPADATAAGDAERLDADVEASRQARYISAFETHVEDLNEAQTSGTLEVVSLINQLEQLEQTAQRSVAAETETVLESGATLPDEAGRERILALCQDSMSRVCSWIFHHHPPPPSPGRFASWKYVVARRKDYLRWTIHSPAATSD